MDPYSGKLYTPDEVAELRSSAKAEAQQIAARLVMVEGQAEHVEHLSRVASEGNRAARRAAARAERQRGQ